MGTEKLRKNKDKIINLYYKERKSLAEISFEFNESYETVRRYFHREGLPLRKIGPNAKSDNTIISKSIALEIFILYKLFDFTQKELADMFDTSTTSVSTIVNCTQRHTRGLLEYVDEDN